MENGYRILDKEVARENRFNYEINVADAPGRWPTAPRSCTAWLMEWLADARRDGGVCWASR